jgi:MraZ protein
MGGMAKLSWDPAGRITLPEAMCEMFGISDWVSVVGLGDRFQIWSRDAFAAHRERQRMQAREGLAALRNQQRLAKAAAS